MPEMTIQTNPNQKIIDLLTLILSELRKQSTKMDDQLQVSRFTLAAVRDILATDRLSLAVLRSIEKLLTPIPDEIPTSLDVEYKYRLSGET